MKRAEVRRLDTSVQRRWRSLCDVFVVVEIKSTVGLPTRYLSILRLPNGNERIIAASKSRLAAVRKCKVPETERR